MTDLKKCEIKNLLDVSSEFYFNLLGYKPEQTCLQSIGISEWHNFVLEKNLSSNSSGIYLPRNRTAIIQGQNPLSLFHEYFGHGLYCEQTKIGKKLVNLENDLLKEEIEAFGEKEFSIEELQEFRKNNKTFQELEEFKEKNLGNYELFAVWTEYLLSDKFGFMDEFEKKYESLKGKDKIILDEVINFSKQYGNLATFYENGLARETTPRRTERLLEEVFGNKKIENSRLILLTGSKKPLSDIDLFSSSDYLCSVKNNWLDLVNFNEEDFERRVKLFEVQVTHPILKGDFVAGDEKYFAQKKAQLRDQPITEEAIGHNLERALTNKKYAEKCIVGSEDWRLSLSYAESYERNAGLLKSGSREGLVV